MHQVGLEELATIDSQELTARFMTAAVTGLADGDIVSMHEPTRADWQNFTARIISGMELSPN